MPQSAAPHRIKIPPQQVAPPFPCERCGYNTVRVADIVNADDVPKGKVLFCTECGRRRQQAAGHSTDGHISGRVVGR